MRAVSVDIVSAVYIDCTADPCFTLHLKQYFCIVVPISFISSCSFLLICNFGKQRNIECWRGAQNGSVVFFFFFFWRDSIVFPPQARPHDLGK